MAEVEIVCEFAGTVFQLQTEVGERVELGQEVVILESMKMEIPVTAPAAGEVSRVLVAESAAVEEGQVLMVLTT